MQSAATLLDRMPHLAFTANLARHTPCPAIDIPAVSVAQFSTAISRNGPTCDYAASQGISEEKAVEFKRERTRIYKEV